MENKALPSKEVRNLSETDLIENLKQSVNLFSELQLNEREKALISIELSKLALLRGESVDDYFFEMWIEHFSEKGLLLPEIMDMIKAAKDIKKYGDIKLSVGEMIENYERIQSEKKEGPINWTQFLKILAIYEKKALAQINKLAGGNHITVEDYFKHKQYLDNQFEKLYGGKAEINSDPDYVQNLNIKPRL